MNHLAHFQLAGECEQMVVGALLGDYVKGPLRGALGPALERGVKLHRRVDAFTDAHPELQALRRCFGPGERRLAGVVTDIFFDHLLTRHWPRFDASALADFDRRTCAVLLRHADVMPVAAARHVQRLVEHGLLGRYGEPETVDATLRHIGERLGQPLAMRDATATAWRLLDEFDAAFLRFYPQLTAVAHAREFRP